MVMSDPIADLLTRIRNANVVRHEVVEVPSSNIKSYSKYNAYRRLYKRFRRI